MFCYFGSSNFRTGKGYSESPDDKLFFKLSKLYADKHPLMNSKHNCEGDKFEGGVTNGNNWYTVSGNYGL